MSRFQNLVSFFAPPAADAPSPLPPRHYDRRFLHFLRAPQDFLYNDTIGSGKFKDIFRFEVLLRRVIVCVNPAAISTFW